MFPVAFGLAPKESYPRLRDFIIAKGMACSPYGAPYLFDALYELDAQDYAFRLLTSEMDRSWMNMIRFGTTITSKSWDIKYKRNMTWNHAWGASPTYMINNKIFGIEPLEPAFRTMLIKPQSGDLASARIKSPTIRGPIHAEFKQKPGGEFNLEVIIPPNTRARVMLPLPDSEDYMVFVNGSKTPVVIEDGSVLVGDFNAGKYRMEIKWDQ